MSEVINLTEEDDGVGLFDERCFICVDSDNNDDESDDEVEFIDLVESEEDDGKEEEPAPEFVPLSPKVQLSNELKISNEMNDDQRQSLYESLLTAEHRYGIHVVEIQHIGEMQRRWAITCDHDIFPPFINNTKGTKGTEQFQCYRCGLVCLTQPATLENRNSYERLVRLVDQYQNQLVE
jgi:hypothetical protein